MKIRKHFNNHTLHTNDKKVFQEFVEENFYDGYTYLNWSDEEIVFFVFIQNKFVVGILATLEYEHGKTCIMLMVVDRKHRYKGIGTSMLEYIVSKYPDHDISLDIKLRNAGLLYFYCSKRYAIIEYIVRKESIVILAMKNIDSQHNKEVEIKKAVHAQYGEFIKRNYDGPFVDLYSPDIECFLALHKGVIKGIVLTKPYGTKRTHIKLLVVAADYRGKGVGSTLLSYVRYMYPGNKITLNVLFKDAGVLYFFCNRGYAVLHPSSMGCDCVTLSIAKASVLSRIPLPAS